MAEITNKLLKQAIADAEAVRETAVASAKLVLEEAITPQIKDMIARRLRVEAEMGGEEKEMEEATELPHEEGEAEGSSEMPADSSEVGTSDNKEPSDDAFDTSAIGDGGENHEDSSTDWYDDWDESDFDLAEVIKELEEDIARLSEAEDSEEEKEDEEEKEMVKEGEGEGHEGEEHEGEVEGEKEEGEEEVDLEEILAELEADEKEMDHDAEKMMVPDEEEKKAMASELARLKGEMAQYREAVNILRGRLQEVNLLNAKLLFTNKMFRKEGLNNDQKVRIIESFDRATTVREVKLVYTALVENLSVAAKSIKNTPRKKVVAEGFASKATRSTAPKQEVIVENTVAKRLQELAGII